MSQSKLTVGQYSLLLLDLKTTHTEFIVLNIISFLMLKSKHTIQQPLQANGTWCQKTNIVRIHNMIHALFINIATRFTHSKILR